MLQSRTQEDAQRFRCKYIVVPEFRDLAFISRHKHFAFLPGEFSASPGADAPLAYPYIYCAPIQDKSMLFMQILQDWDPCGC